MTEEIIKSITNVEAEAELIKAEAHEKAAAILSGAENEVAQKEQASVENCKKYREEAWKKALAEADSAYEKTLNEKANEARAYCEEALQSAEPYIGNIVGRIIRGNR